MKKLLLIPALIATMAMATEQKTQYDWEVTYWVGHFRGCIAATYNNRRLNQRLQINSYRQELTIIPCLNFLMFSRLMKLVN